MSALVPSALLFGVGLLAAWVATSVLPIGSGTGHFVLALSLFYHADLFAFGMAVAVLMVNIEDGIMTLPKWCRKAAALTLAGLVLATVILVDPGLIVTFRGAVPYETLTALSAALLLALVILPSADSSVSFLTRVLDTRVLGAVGLASYSMFLTCQLDIAVRFTTFPPVHRGVMCC